MKNKFKSYTFWLAIIGAVIILINTLGTTFGFSVDEVAITSIFTAVLGIFVALGLVKKDNDKQKQAEELSQSESQTEDDNEEELSNVTDEKLTDEQQKTEEE